MLDKDGDGRVSADEFKELMSDLGVTFTDETAAEAIANDGRGRRRAVSPEELTAYMSTPWGGDRSSDQPSGSGPWH